MKRWTVGAFLLIAATMISSAAELDYAGEVARTMEPTKKVVYKSVGGRNLSLHVFEPKGPKTSDRRPCFVTIHGGGWVGGEPRRMYNFAAHYADLGWVGISIEYRLLRSAPGLTPYDCVKDGRSAIRYIRSHAAEFGVDPEKIVANGGSAGGHVAAGTALFDGIDEKGDDSQVSSAANALVLYYPVIDTSKEGYGNSACGPKWREISPLHCVKPGSPPTIIFHGTADKTCPYKGAVAFRDAMVKAGNRCDLVSAEGQGHTYLMHTKEIYEDTLRKTDAFLTDIGFLKCGAVAK